MGFLSSLLPSAFAMSSPKLAIQSPFTTSSLTKIALSEMLGVPNALITRADAMKVAPVARGRGLICGTLSRYPLTQWQLGATEAEDVQLVTPEWMTGTKTMQSPISRMLWTLDDLLFAGLSLWAVERDANDVITDAARVDPSNWSVDSDSLGVLVNGAPVTDPKSVILFEGPQEGLLTIAEDAVRASRNLSKAWQRRVESPIPLVTLNQTDPNGDLDDDEIDDAIADLENSRINGATTFVPYGYEIQVHGEVKTDLFVEGRNAERLDWGNYLNIPAAMLDGSLSTATLTYSTTEGKRSEFVDYSLFYWASAIEARLSLDDVTPPGTCVRFNLKWLTNTVQQPLSVPSED